MITYALLALIALVCFGTNKRSARAITIFIVPAILFQLASVAGIIPGDYFHLTAGVLDWSVIGLLGWLTRECIIAFFLGLVSLFSIFSNVLGWVAYEHGEGPAAYDYTFIAIYALVLAVALMEWWTHARAGRNHLRFRRASH